MSLEKIIAFLDEIGDPIKQGLEIEAIAQAFDLAKALSSESDEIQNQAFSYLTAITDTPTKARSTRQIRIAILYWWSKSSNNLTLQAFAKGYSFGKENEAHNNEQRLARKKLKSTKSAAQGRKAIGWNTKLKVRTAAENFRHKSKEAAAYEISELVGLSPGRVKQLLSELFPGKEWHTSNDT